jgi:hypothetical protein
MKNKHRTFCINNWKKYGLKCREGETYHKIYDKVMSYTNCELCHCEFTSEIKFQRCMDHDHQTGYYRKTLCRRCNASYMKAPQKLKVNNTSGHMFICNQKTKNKSGNYSFTWRYTRKINGELFRKGFKSKTKAIAYSFIMLLRHPLS